MKGKSRRPCHWCGRRANVVWMKKLEAGLCEHCREVFDYYSDERECFVCGSKNGLKKMRKSGLILCQKHRREQVEINLKKAVKKYAQARLMSNLTPEQRKQATKDILCRYFSDLKEREQEMVPVCAECASNQDVVSVITKEGLKLLCPDCRGKIYQRSGRKRVRMDLGIKCDRCETWGARKVTNADIYLCAKHYGEHRAQVALKNKLSKLCERCDSADRVRMLGGHYLCSLHQRAYRKEKKEMDPILRIFVIPPIRT